MSEELSDTIVDRLVTADRATLKDKQHMTTEKAQQAKALGIANPFGLPESVMNQNGNHLFFQRQQTRILLLSDIHVPYPQH